MRPQQRQNDQVFSTNLRRVQHKIATPGESFWNVDVDVAIQLPLHEDRLFFLTVGYTTLHTRLSFFADLPFQTHDPTQPTENKNFWPTEPNPVQPNPRVNPTHRQLWAVAYLFSTQCKNLKRQVSVTMLLGYVTCDNVWIRFRVICCELWQVDNTNCLQRKIVAVTMTHRQRVVYRIGLIQAVNLYR